MLALAQIWTFLPKTPPFAITTFGPITQPSGITTEGSICAEGFTFAVGWILVILTPSFSRVVLRFPEIAFFVFAIFSLVPPVSEVNS